MPPGCDSRVIYNAVDTTRYPFNPVPDDYLLFVGRMSPDKGILDAIEIARAARRRLLVLAKINEPPERAYFRDEVLPALRGVDSEVLEQPEERVKVQAYQFATATLFPIAWREPFGLVMVESMATGTPVIAYRAGSVPEIVKHGETGFVCATREQAIAAVEATPSLSRPACRQDVETRFSPELMVRNHERLYAEIVRAQQPGHDDFDLVAAG
jgi:glycosyltransferase involved in cell wall biosynthesis